MLRLDQVRIATVRRGPLPDSVTEGVGPVDLALSPGEWTAVIGPAGCGKTPLARVLAGLEAPTEGRRFYDALSTDRQRVQIDGRGLRYLPGDEPFSPEVTVRELLQLRATLRGYHGSGRRRILDAAMERWDLVGIWSRRLGRLPRTQRRRVALADAFLGSPGLLVLDNPFWGCDDMTIRRLQQAILAEGAEARERTAMVALARSPFELVGITSRVVELGRSGRVLFQGGWQAWKTKRAEATAYRLVAVGRGSQIEEAIAKIEGVHSVLWHEGGPQNTFEVRADSAPRVREAIFRMMAAQDWPILELTAEANEYGGDSAYASQPLPRRRTTRRMQAAVAADGSATPLVPDASAAPTENAMEEPDVAELTPEGELLAETTLADSDDAAPDPSNAADDPEPETVSLPRNDSAHRTESGSLVIRPSHRQPPIGEEST